LETIRIEREIITKDLVSPQLSWIFDVGKLYHSLYRDWYLGPRGVYLGRWKCIACGWTTDGSGDHSELLEDGTPTKSFFPDDSWPTRTPMRLVEMPEKCGGCGAQRRDKDYTASGREVPGEHPVIVYDEWMMVNEELKIRAKSDGVRRRMYDGVLVGQELKSISEKGFGWRLKYGAKPEHKTQSMVCTWLSGLKIGEVVYLNKGGWKSPEDFIFPVAVPFDEKYMEGTVFHPVRTLRDCVEKGVLAPRLCASENVERAKECGLKDLCFEETNG
jgi:hypothetical protein